MDIESIEEETDLVVTNEKDEQKGENETVNEPTVHEGNETNEHIDSNDKVTETEEKDGHASDNAGGEADQGIDHHELSNVKEEEENTEDVDLGTGMREMDIPIINEELEHLDLSQEYDEFNMHNQHSKLDELDNIDEENVTDEDEYYQQYDREQLLTQYKEALEERSRLQTSNQQFQTQLVEYFKKKKTDEKAPEIEKNVTDQEQRYLKYMSNLEELQASEQRQKTVIETQLNELKEKCQEKQSRVEEASKEFEKFKYDIGQVAVNSRSGKPIPEKDLENYRATELKKEQDVIAVRLENIKLKNRLKKKEMQLKAKEELAEGLHLIDFEQLKIENQTYNEKIEERNEELLKLRKKITTTVQVLTHLKEKLQFVQGENTEQRLQLKDIDITVAQRRDILTRMKQARDTLRMDNNKLKHKCGLLGNEPLLRDFEERENERLELTERLSKLKESHMQINMNLTTLKKKIEKSK